MVSVVVPAFNEGASLGSVLLRTHQTLQGLALPYELIVVDDGSTDQTAATAISHGARVISNGGNLGKGYALRTGLDEAKGDVMVTLDADGENRPEEIQLLLEPILKGYPPTDIVIGSRFAGDIEPGAATFSHILGNKILNVVIFFLTGRWVSDSQCGFRAFKRELVQSLSLESKGYEIESEMTVKLLKRGCAVTVVPVTYSRRVAGTSRLRTFRDGFRILRTIIRVFFAS